MEVSLEQSKTPGQYTPGSVSPPLTTGGVEIGSTSVVVVVQVQVEVDTTVRVGQVQLEVDTTVGVVQSQLEVGLGGASTQVGEHEDGDPKRGQVGEKRGSIGEAAAAWKSRWRRRRRSPSCPNVPRIFVSSSSSSSSWGLYSEKTKALQLFRNGCDADDSER